MVTISENTPCWRRAKEVAFLLFYIPDDITLSCGAAEIEFAQSRPEDADPPASLYKYI